jgi:predicted NAD/FAD-binding protein
VWSADPRQMWTFPARFVVDFFANHGMLGFAERPHWRTVTGGSRSYVDAVTRPWRDRLRLDTPITAITRHEDHVRLTPRGGEPERFDEVVLATHSDQALSMLADASDREFCVTLNRSEAIDPSKILRTISYDERFQRLWQLYLSFCEAGFTERRIGSVQIVLGKPRWRGHLATAEATAPPSLVSAAGA